MAIGTGKPSLRELAQLIEYVARAHPCWSQVHQYVYTLTDQLNLMARLEEVNEQDRERHQPPNASSAPNKV